MARKNGELSVERLRVLARSGAERLLGELRAEITAIERTFPELAEPKKRQAAVKAVKRRARTLSAEARKAVSIRMKKYWAERRKAKKR